ncbi:MAG: glycosyltransferase [Nitrospirae bacterium]|nr:glycosyltransferase [Nitrospirota bacterium]
MEGLSVIIPVFNKIETTLRCIESVMEQNEHGSFEIIIIDNGSTDGTQEVFLVDKKIQNPPSPPFAKGGNTPLTLSPLERGAGVCNRGESSPPLEKGDVGGFSEQITYIRNEQNLGVAQALNLGAGAAKRGVLCFMHNDVFVLRENWTAEIRNFVMQTSNAGVVGLYGAKTLRRDGSFRGKTIVHAEEVGAGLKPAPTSRKKPFEKVAVVDGLLLAMKKSVYEKIGGFCEDFKVHYYDKDVSMRALKNGFDNYALNIPFEHACGTTRDQIKTDDAIRDEAQRKFIEIWRDHLPADVSTWREKVGWLFR